MRSELPWQGIKTRNKKDKYNMIMERKLTISLEDLCFKNGNKFCLNKRRVDLFPSIREKSEVRREAFLPVFEVSFTKLIRKEQIRI